MGTLRHLRSGQRSLLEPEHLVGRSSRCALRVQQSYVSSQHAAIRWTGNGWELRDLGSRNGTYVGGVHLQPRDPRVLVRGAQVAFGLPADLWELEDDSPPRPWVAPVTGGEPLPVERDLLAIPSPNDPRATIYRGKDGRWQLERFDEDESIRVIDDRSTFELDGVSWEFRCPLVVPRTSAIEPPQDTRWVALHFGVSRDEEHVALRAEHDGRSHDLGDRSHNYLLLILARRRLEDTRAGLPETSCGWMDQEALLQGLRITAAQLNVDIFRIRRQFASEPLSLPDAGHIVERRPRAKQLRIGVSRLSVSIV